jgi:hypothetical protein
MVLISALFLLFRSLINSRTTLAAENLTLRQQLALVAEYLSGGALGKWEFAFTAVVTFCAYKGLQSYRFIGLGWILHTVWDITHHFYGCPSRKLHPASYYDT